MPLPKYHTDGPMKDPILRCDSCAQVERVDTIKKLGMCPNCGNKKFRNALTLNELDLQKMRSWDIDPEFMTLFQEVSNV